MNQGHVTKFDLLSEQGSEMNDLCRKQGKVWKAPEAQTYPTLLWVPPLPSLGLKGPGA